jgi:hypothetical protein
VIRLRRSLGVSYSALGWRLVNLGLITKAQRERLERDEEMLKSKERLLFGDTSKSCVNIPQFSDRQRSLALKAFLRGGITVSKLAEWLETSVVHADEIAQVLIAGEEPHVPTAP